MAARDRVQKYRQTGAASDLIRVEVLLPASKRDEIIANAARLRAEHRAQKEGLRRMIDEALEKHRVRILDNIDLNRLSDLHQRARVVATALMERGDANAFVLGRKIMAEAEKI